MPAATAMDKRKLPVHICCRLSTVRERNSSSEDSTFTHTTQTRACRRRERKRWEEETISDNHSCSSSLSVDANIQSRRTFIRQVFSSTPVAYGRRAENREQNSRCRELPRRGKLQYRPTGVRQTAKRRRIDTRLLLRRRQKEKATAAKSEGTTHRGRKKLSRGCDELLTLLCSPSTTSMTRRRGKITRRPLEPFCLNIPPDEKDLSCLV